MGGSYGQLAGTGVHESSRLSWTSIEVGTEVSWSNRSHTSQSGRMSFTEYSRSPTR